MELSRYEYHKLVNDIADAAVVKLAQMLKLSVERPKWVTLPEAAAILHRSKSWMRQNKDRFQHKKLGTSEQGRIMFLEEDLYKFLQ